MLLSYEFQVALSAPMPRRFKNIARHEAIAATFLVPLSFEEISE